MTQIWNKEQSNIHPEAVIKGGCVIHSHVWIGMEVEIGYGTKVQAFAFIPSGVKIGSNCFIGPGVTFTNDKHPPSNGEDWRETIVETGVAIGANSTILPGVTIGSHAIIGAGSVVTKNVQPGTTVIGNPARTLDKSD